VFTELPPALRAAMLDDTALNPVAAPTPALLLDQDVPTIYLEIPRARYAHAHTHILPALIDAGLHIDVLTSQGSLAQLHAPGALDAAAGALVGVSLPVRRAEAAAALASPRGPTADTREPPGTGAVFVRVTAPDARLLREAARIRMPLPLCAHTLRALDA